MKVGLQFFSVRNSLKADPEGTMRKIAAIGYKNWETCSFNPDSPYNYGLDMPLDKAQALIKELGVNIIGCHLLSKDLEPENRAALIENLDYQAGINCWNPGLAALFANSLDEVLTYCGYMNEVGKLCKDRGMRFHYHNHHHEFLQFDGKYILDIIAENTDPELVDIEIDTFWAARGGMDPVALIKKYGSRVTMIHQKDMSADAKVNLLEHLSSRQAPVDREELNKFRKPTDFVEIGTGIMDIQAIIDAANEVGVKYITLEQDMTLLDEIDSVTLSMKNFREKYKNLDWE